MKTISKIVVVAAGMLASVAAASPVLAGCADLPGRTRVSVHADGLQRTAYQVGSVAPVADAAGPPIVGLWVVHYTSDQGAQDFHTYQQFHGDGLEFETPDFAPGVCMGTWEQTTQARTYKLFHVGFTVGAIPGTYRFELRELDTVSRDRNSFEGRYDQKFFDKDGNLVGEDQGTLQGTRLSVDQF